MSFRLCHGIFFGPTELSDEKCQTWLPPAPTHLWPWPYQPWPSQRNQFLAFISGLFWRLQWRMKDIFFFICLLFVYQLFPQPGLCTNCSSGCLCRAEWALRVEQCGAAGRVHISTFPPWWIKSIESGNAHPEQTLTCFSTPVSDKTTSCWEKEPMDARRSLKKKQNKQHLQRIIIGSKQLYGIANSIYIWFTLVCLSFDFFRDSNHLPELDTHTRACAHAHTQRHTQSFKEWNVRSVQENTQNYKIPNWMTFFWHIESITNISC